MEFRYRRLMSSGTNLPKISTKFPKIFLRKSPKTFQIWKNNWLKNSRKTSILDLFLETHSKMLTHMDKVSTQTKAIILTWTPIKVSIQIQTHINRWNLPKDSPNPKVKFISQREFIMLTTISIRMLFLHTNLTTKTTIPMDQWSQKSSSVM